MWSQRVDTTGWGRAPGLLLGVRVTPVAPEQGSALRPFLSLPIRRRGSRVKDVKVRTVPKSGHRPLVPFLTRPGSISGSWGLRPKIEMMLAGPPPFALMSSVLYTQRHSWPRLTFRACDTWKGSLSPALVSLLQGPQDVWAQFSTLSSLDASLCPSAEPSFCSVPAVGGRNQEPCACPQGPTPGGISEGVWRGHDQGGSAAAQGQGTLI